jgi:hypothetical protein
MQRSKIAERFRNGVNKQMCGNRSPADGIVIGGGQNLATMLA